MHILLGGVLIGGDVSSMMSNCFYQCLSGRDIRLLLLPFGTLAKRTLALFGTLSWTSMYKSSLNLFVLLPLLVR